MEVTKLDHLVLTVQNIEKTVEFYKMVLGMEAIEFGEGRVALKFGNQKINLHKLGKEFEPKAQRPTPGSADLCFITTVTLEDAMKHVQNCAVEIIEGPLNRSGAVGPLLSFYFRDPSGNLIEVANQL